MSANIINQIKRTSGTIRNLQKIYDVDDWTDQRMRMVARACLHVAPRPQPRLWEFCAAHLSLIMNDKLNGESEGLSFGSGREPLVFSIASNSKKLTVTDLYNSYTSWGVARTNSPLDYVLSAAPAGFDSSKIDVLSMDMRDIIFPDESFDYCYSISAFEHIGVDDDFIRHLKEVRRVLRPDGIYVLTTEVRLFKTSYCSKGNFVFSPDHILALFEAAGLFPDPQFDMRLSDLGENHPRDKPRALHYNPAAPIEMSLGVRDEGGILSVPAVFLLRKKKKVQVEVLGFEDTVRSSHRALDYRTRIRGNAWMRLNPWGGASTPNNPFVDLYNNNENPPAPGTLVFNTGYNYYGSATMQARIVLTPSPLSNQPFQVAISVNEWQREDLNVLRNINRQLATINEGPGRSAVLQLEFRTNSECRYAIFGAPGKGQPLLSALDIQVRRAP